MHFKQGKQKYQVTNVQMSKIVSFASQRHSTVTNNDFFSFDIVRNHFKLISTLKPI